MIPQPPGSFSSRRIGHGFQMSNTRKSIKPSKRYFQLSRRSEEHTSELQSPCNLVCRLLLEKKKIIPRFFSPIRSWWCTGRLTPYPCLHSLHKTVRLHSHVWTMASAYHVTRRQQVTCILLTT